MQVKEPLLYKTDNEDQTQRGPVMTDFGGELDSPVLRCMSHTPKYRCPHLGIHDWHYFFCSAQEASNTVPENSAPYPWRGAGIQLRHQEPNPRCPYLKEKEA